MIDEAVDKHNLEHAWLNAVIFNSQGSKENGEHWRIDDFMPHDEVTPADNEQYTKTWSENFKKRMSLIGGP